jgi:hypothetical protein
VKSRHGMRTTACALTVSGTPIVGQGISGLKVA